jgi:uncharacterized protein YwgA
VDRADEHLSVREAVLVILDAVGGVVEGRTAVQKLSYFAALAINEELGHHAHFYGPYSRPVESVLINEAFAGDLEENMEHYQSWSGPDIRQYTYTLADPGRQAVQEIRKENPELCNRIDKVVGDLGKLVPGLPQHPLSLAAKVDFILRSTGGSAQAAEIPVLAREHGWEVTEHDVEQAAKILEGLGRVAAPGATP